MAGKFSATFNEKHFAPNLAGDPLKQSAQPRPTDVAARVALWDFSVRLTPTPDFLQHELLNAIALISGVPNKICLYKELLKVIKSVFETRTLKVNRYMHILWIKLTDIGTKLASTGIENGWRLN